MTYWMSVVSRSQCEDSDGDITGTDAISIRIRFRSAVSFSRLSYDQTVAASMS